jgi:hypothetical protein
VNVQRYRQWCSGTHGHNMITDQNGDYVLYTDYAILHDKLDEALRVPTAKLESVLIGELSAAQDHITFMQTVGTQQVVTIRELREQLSEMRQREREQSHKSED